MKTQRPIFRRTSKPEAWTPREIFEEWWDEAKESLPFILIPIVLMGLAMFFATW